MISDELIEESRRIVHIEIDKFGIPGHQEFIIEKVKDLSKQLNADERIAQVGANLMDLKLGEAFSKGKLKEHVGISSSASQDFLAKFELSEEEKKNIINCIEAHHRHVDFTCIEAEICCNADCYRFLYPSNFVKNMYRGSKKKEFIEMIDHLEEKIDEKFSYLSLDSCKKELTPYYKIYKDLIDKARK